MKQFKKTCIKLLSYNIRKKSHTKKQHNGKNNYMVKDIKNFQTEKDKNNCNIHVISPKITDEDITALFNGIVNVVKKKIELDTKAEMINMNVSIQKLLKELQEKQAECNRLKNEIIYLKSQIK